MLLLELILNFLVNYLIYKLVHQFLNEKLFSFLFLSDFFVDLSIIAAKPISLALAFLINFTHSRLDLPVVITSSIIKTFDPFLILKPLLNVNFPLTLSQNIVSFFKNFQFHNQ